MSPRIVNEENLQARELEIINAATLLMQSIGIENLTMDKLVAQVPYSKGTVYKHFIGKEDLLLAISNHAITILSDFFERASQIQGCSRGKMLLLDFSYLLYAMLHPAIFQSLICSKSPNVYSKSSEKRRDEQKQLEMKLLGIIYGIIEQAISEEQLSLPEHINIQQVCFSNWSAAYGTISLLSGEIDECDNRKGLVVEQELFNQCNILFDGLAWLPLSNQSDHKNLLKQSLKEVFKKELDLIEKNGYVFNF